jgi:hypothetical protein
VSVIQRESDTRFPNPPRQGDGLSAWCAKNAATISLSIATLLLTTMLALTLAELSFLRSNGWSPLRRSATEWPSLLALGPHGYLLGVAFVTCATATLLVAVGGFHVSWSRASTLSALALPVAAFGLLGVVFPADLPGVAHESWHAMVHNSLYPLIPLGTLASALLLVVDRKLRWRRVKLFQTVNLTVMLVSYAATNIDAIAQLARYPAFSATLASVVVYGRVISTRAEAQAAV